MKSIYNFRDNSTLAKGWQQAEVNDGMYEHPFGLPGTESWWDAIDKKRLPAEIVEGAVVSYRPSGGEGRPALFTLSDNSTWIAYGKNGLETVYCEGQQVRVQFVTLHPRKRWAKEHKLILEIEREDAD